MGLNNNQSSSIYLQISNGKLVRSFSSPTPKSVSRTNKVGKEVHEEFYDSLTGYVKGISTKETEYGKFWVINVNDGESDYTLSTNYSGGYAVSFLKAIPNADLSRVMTITPKIMVDGDKRNSVMFINQDGKGLKHYWTKDNPGQLPNLEKIKIKGKDTWDDTKRLEYLENFVKDLFNSKVEPASAVDEDTPF
jgi:hypothetical protein